MILIKVHEVHAPDRAIYINALKIKSVQMISNGQTYIKCDEGNYTVTESPDVVATLANNQSNDQGAKL